MEKGLLAWGLVTVWWPELLLLFSPLMALHMSVLKACRLMTMLEALVHKFGTIFSTKYKYLESGICNTSTVEVNHSIRHPTSRIEGLDIRKTQCYGSLKSHNWPSSAFSDGEEVFWHTVPAFPHTGLINYHGDWFETSTSGEAVCSFTSSQYHGHKNDHQKRLLPLHANYWQC